MEIAFVAQTLISLTFSNFSNYFEGLWCVLSSSFALFSHFSFHFSLVDVYCDLSLLQLDLVYLKKLSRVSSSSRRTQLLVESFKKKKKSNHLICFGGKLSSSINNKYNLSATRSALQWENFKLTGGHLCHLMHRKHTAIYNIFLIEVAF